MDEAEDGTGDFGGGGGDGFERTDLKSLLDKYPEEETAETETDTNTESETDNVTHLNKEGKDNKETETPSLEQELENYKGEGEGDLLNQINSLGLVRDGLPLEFNDVEDIKNALNQYAEGRAFQEEYDQKFNQMTQEFQGKEAKFNEQLQAFEQEKAGLANVQREYEIFSHVLNSLKETDEDVYNELAEAFQKQAQAFDQTQNNPMVQAIMGEFKSLREEIASLKNGNVTQENEKLNEQWSQGLGEVQKTYAAKMRSLGVVPKWDAVKKLWSQTDDKAFDVKKAFFAVHGEDIQKALAAKNKKTETKMKSDARLGKQFDGGTRQAEPSRSVRRADYLNSVAARHE